MKNSFIVAIIFVATLFAFEQANAQFVLGAKLGYTASKLSTEIDSIKSSMSSGFHIGAFARIGKRVHLQPEFYYTISGATLKFSGANPVDDWSEKVNVGTLDIPVLVGFDIIKSKLFKWRIMAGPEVSFLINSKLKDVSGPTNTVTTADVNTTNWYIQAGTGIDVLIFTLDIRYQAGLNSLINTVTTTTGSTSTNYPVNTKGNLFVVSLGFKIL
jgi:hypothetical protein